MFLFNILVVYETLLIIIVSNTFLVSFTCDKPTLLRLKLGSFTAEDS